MKFQPAKDRAALKPRLDGMGRVVEEDNRKNPFAQLARYTAGPAGRRQRRRMAEVLGATPPRDGPFAASARAVAIVNPPKSRQKQDAIVGPSSNVLGDSKIQDGPGGRYYIKDAPITEPEAPPPSKFLGTANNQPHFVTAKEVRGRPQQVGGFSIVKPPGDTGPDTTL